MIKLSRSTLRTIAKYGAEECVRAYQCNLEGEGPHYCGGYRGLRVGDAMINAGREIITGKRDA